MKKTATQPSDIEQILSDLGFSFTVVDHCPHPACEVCRPGERAKAA